MGLAVRCGWSPSSYSYCRAFLARHIAHQRECTCSPQNNTMPHITCLHHLLLHHPHAGSGHAIPGDIRLGYVAVKSIESTICCADPRVSIPTPVDITLGFACLPPPHGISIFVVAPWRLGFRLVLSHLSRLLTTILSRNRRPQNTEPPVAKTRNRPYGPPLAKTRNRPS